MYTLINGTIFEIINMEEQMEIYPDFHIGDFDEILSEWDHETFSEIIQEFEGKWNLPIFINYPIIIINDVIFLGLAKGKRKENHFLTE